jgi:nitrite reductase/ring-hydroxylating ferredoxin subunit
MLRNVKTRALTVDDVPPGTCVKAVVAGKDVAIFNVDGQIYATQNDCTHWGGPLCDGSLAGEVVTCPWHGSQFNVRTGEVVQDPAEKPLATYLVEVRDGVLILEQGPRVPSEAEELGEVT